MQRALKLVMALATLLPGVCVATAQTQTVPGAALKNELKAQYQVSKKSARSMADIKTVLVVQKTGIVAFPPEKVVLPNMTYKDGELKAPDSLAMGNSGGQAPRMLQVGEKVYVTRMDVNVAGDKVSFTVQECDPCNGAQEVSASTAALVFEFPQGYLASAEASQAADVIGEVLAFDKPEAANSAAPSDAVAGAAGEEVLTNKSVMKMVAARLPEEVIITKIETSETNFDVSTAGLVELNNNQVSAAIVKVMLITSKNNSGGSAQAASNEEGAPVLKHNSVDTTETAAAPEPTQESSPTATFAVFHDHGNGTSPENWRYCKGVLYIYADRVKYVVSSTQGGRTDDFEVSYDGISEIRKNAWPIMQQQAFHIKLKTGLSLNFLPEGTDVASVLAAFPSPPRK